MTMTLTNNANPAPFCLYVLWHHRSSLAPPLVQEIYNWFQAPSTEISRAGLGLPVYYRMKPYPFGGGQGKRPRKIDLDSSRVNVVVPLIDEHMAADKNWRDYLADIVAEISGKGIVYPVPLHHSAYRLKGVETINFLRIDRASDDVSETEVARQLRRVERIRQRLTEVANRFLLSALHPGLTDQITVFLSHAKSDGLRIAETLRNEIYGYGQLQAFFDESDIPVGQDFSRALTERTEKASCLLAIVTDLYASRPWCREEIALTRKPQQENFNNPQNDRWFMNTVLVVDYLQKSITRMIPELGNAPALRWSDGQEKTIVDTLMRELLISCYQRLNAQVIQSKQGRHVLSWVPDPISLMEVVSTCEGVTEIVYPGHGLAAAEKTMMQRLFGKSLKFLTFEEVLYHQ